MKNILVVDDNENNRMLLRALLEDYAEDTGEEIKIQEAVNGLEASLIAEEQHFHLVLMDIMMPEMDGIEATRRIRACDSKAMIVAVSAVDDGDRQRQILRNGAEDYIAKPINADIFTARLGNYFSLIESREAPKHNYPHAVNLYTQEVYSRQFNFFIGNDDELSEFWEYYLLDSSDRNEKLSDAIRTIYALASIGIKMGANLQIIVEQSIEHMYITLVGMEAIDAKFIKLIMAKNPTVRDFKTDPGRFTVRLAQVEKEIIPVVVTKAVEQAPVPIAVPQETPATYMADVVVTQVYDYMDAEDLMDLKEYVGKLNSLMMVVGGEIEAHEVEEISYNLQNISRIATGYTDSYPIGQALASMGSVISNYTQLFMDKSNDLAPMCAAFGRDLSNWIQLIFVEGATNVHYMDDTIIANAQMIESILTMDVVGTSDAVECLDDIFDF
ncbi:MAG: response regulator transcription factor [Sulfuricurvum sp.]